MSEKTNNAKKPQGPNPRRCTSCGFFVRGMEHDRGIHHKTGKGGKAHISPTR